MRDDTSKIADLYAKMRDAETNYADERDATWPQELAPPVDHVKPLIAWGLAAFGVMLLVVAAYCHFRSSHR